MIDASRIHAGWLTSIKMEAQLQGVTRERGAYRAFEDMIYLGKDVNGEGVECTLNHEVLHMILFDMRIENAYERGPLDTLRESWSCTPPVFKDDPEAGGLSWWH